MGFFAAVYGLVCYAVFLASFLYSIGFVGNLALLFWKWQAIPAVVWSASSPAVEAFVMALFALGWLIVLLSTFMIDHFELFGLRQVYLRLRGLDYTPPGFTQRALYGFVRHPIMLGFLIAFWTTPHMTVGHLLFSIATTGYILVGIMLEERDLVRYIDPEYEAYRRPTLHRDRVPLARSVRAGNLHA